MPPPREEKKSRRRDALSPPESASRMTPKHYKLRFRCPPRCSAKGRWSEGVLLVAEISLSGRAGMIWRLKERRQRKVCVMPITLRRRTCLCVSLEHMPFGNSHMGGYFRRQTEMFAQCNSCPISFPSNFAYAEMSPSKITAHMSRIYIITIKRNI